uniref:Uncharacterized protein n=1 Tax=Kryptolebias marmoratus TaxID=37003 RepID=A0A3Q3GWZ4_KRYMA
MFGREARLPVDVCFGLSQAGEEDITHHQYVDKLRKERELSEDAVGDLRRLVAARTGTRCDGIVLKRWRAIFGDRVTRGDLAECRWDPG